MKQFSIWILLLALSLGGEGRAEDNQESLYTGVAIAVVGDLDRDHVERVRAFVETHSGLPVREVVVPLVTGHSLGEIADALIEAKDPQDAALVVLFAGPEQWEEHTVYRYEAGVGVVNVSALRDDDDERFARRMEKLAMRSIGLLLDVPMVPNPQSALWSYRTMEDLDAMGRNFDPPSLLRLQQNARALGVPLIEDSPYLLLRE